MIIALAGALMSVLGFGNANVLIKKNLSSLTIPQTLTNSTIFGGLTLLVLNLFSLGAISNLTIDLVGTALLISIGEVILYLSLYAAFAKANVTIANCILSCYPIISTLFGVVFYQEVIPAAKWLMILLLIGGALLVSIDWQGVLRDGFQKSDLTKGLGITLICMLIHAIYFPVLLNFTDSGNWELKLFFIKLFASVIFIVMFNFLRREKITVDRKLLPATALLGFLEIVGWVGLSWASNNTDTSNSIIIALTSASPLVTAVSAYIFLKERLKPLQYIGIAIIISTLIVLSLVG